MAKPGGFSRIELLQGTLDMIILQTLRWGPRHGYGIAQMIRSSSSNALQVEAGSLYPALHRLEHQGWISASWDVSENRQRSEEHTSELQSQSNLVCRLLLEKK